MNRLSRVAFVVTVALGVLAPVVPASALAAPIGGIIIISGTGTNLDPLRLRTSSGCPAQATAYYATMHGHGFPPDGQIITSSTEAGLSRSIGFDVYPALVMRDYADENHTTLVGRYDISVYCIDRLTQQSYGEFAGSLEFTGPTSYQAIGAAKPVGPPPPPLPMVGDGPPLAPGLIGPAPGADSRSPSTGGRLASQRTDVTVQGVPWPVLVLVGAVIGGLVAAAVALQIGKRRSS
ncbi:MAG TPA: hypothetical protein VHY21_13345 [Pseudonocardiaceae bacterium]|jgi:hypothetical protein|nr:hypothetical protein [Pseudonocardiaceae bacterium]